MFSFAAHVQHLSFRQLGIKEGMPSNVTYFSCVDSTGQIWVSTNDGLVSYDGNAITTYVKENYPGLPQNETGFLSCDSRNRIWVCTNSGMAIIDEQRRIKRVQLHDSLLNVDIESCYEAIGTGMLVMTRRKTFFCKKDQDGWIPFTWFDSVRKGNAVLDIRPFDSRYCIVVMNSRIVLVDFNSKHVYLDLALP